MECMFFGVFFYVCGVVWCYTFVWCHCFVFFSGLVTLMDCFQQETSDSIKHRYSGSPRGSPHRSVCHNSKPSSVVLGLLCVVGALLRARCSAPCSALCTLHSALHTPLSALLSSSLLSPLSSLLSSPLLSCGVVLIGVMCIGMRANYCSLFLNRGWSAE